VNNSEKRESFWGKEREQKGGNSLGSRRKIWAENLYPETLAGGPTVEKSGRESRGNQKCPLMPEKGKAWGWVCRKLLLHKNGFTWKQ